MRPTPSDPSNQLASVIGVFSHWFTKEESAAGEAGHVVGFVFNALDVQGEFRTTFNAGTTDSVRWFNLDVLDSQLAVG